MTNMIKPGDRFGRLTVIKDNGTSRGNDDRVRRIYLCKCDCGNIKEIGSNNLTNKGTRSCGCLRRDMMTERLQITITENQQSNKFQSITDELEQRSLGYLHKEMFRRK